MPNLPVPVLADGLAPNTVAPADNPTRLCGVCATLIRYWPLELRWRHVAIGFDHAPDPVTWQSLRVADPRTAEDITILEDHGLALISVGTAAAAERDPSLITESELRLLDGNR